MDNPPGRGVAGFYLAVFFVMILGIIALYDFWCVYSDTPCWSVSEWVQHWSTESPLVALLLGIILGHLFFSRRQ